MRWWLDRGVDGFRMDVINMISKNTALPDGRLIGAGPFGDGRPYYTGGPRLHEFLAEMHREVFARRVGQLLTVAEMPDVTVDEARLFTDPARAEVDMVFQFEHVQLDHGTNKWDQRPLRLRDLKTSLNCWQAGLAARGWNSLYWNNHDQPRAVSRFGNDGQYRTESAKLLATVLHMHRGTPYIYQGEELGMTNGRFDDLSSFRDIQSLNYYRHAVEGGVDPNAVLAQMQRASRDNGRTPMQWNAEPGAGFTDGHPWIAINANAAEINAEDQLEDPGSVFAHYRRLIALRHREPVVAYGDFTLLLSEHETVYAFTRRFGEQELLMLANFSAGVVHLRLGELPDEEAWNRSEVLIGNYPLPIDLLALRPWEGRVHRRAMAKPPR
jgi:oligo-1,6-glucosidase